jgi:predicted ArsR family transcriptional regulator
MRPFDLDRRLASLASLGDPLRRDLYHLAAARDDGVSRDEAATALGVSRALAAYHLDKLVRAGLLDTRFERRSGRRGPGAGRTAKLYLRSAHPVEVALPARDYQLMAGLLARAVGADPSGAARSELLRAARELGTEAAAGRDRRRSRGEDPLRSALAEHGYEPSDDQGVLRLRNCPFGRLAEAHRDLVCSANLAFLEGVAEAHPRAGRRAVLDPRPGHCCVALVPA